MSEIIIALGEGVTIGLKSFVFSLPAFAVGGPIFGILIGLGLALYWLSRGER